MNNDHISGDLLPKPDEHPVASMDASDIIEDMDDIINNSGNMKFCLEQDMMPISKQTR